VEGIIGAVVGAVVGAVIAWALGRRQVTRQLAHDRNLANLAALRRVLDDAATLGGEALNRTNQIYTVLTERPIEGDPFARLEAVDVSEDLSDEDVEAIQDLIHEARSMMERHREAHVGFLEAPPAVFVMSQRLLLHVPHGDPVVDRFLGVFEALGEFLGALPEDPSAVDAEREQELTARRQAVSDAQFAFLREGRARVDALLASETGAPAQVQVSDR
jgi:hypothetical protein